VDLPISRSSSQAESTHDPPYEQWFVELEVSAGLFVVVIMGS
jgi:hypothetical protein